MDDDDGDGDDVNINEMKLRPQTENIAKNGKTYIGPGPSMAYRLIAAPISFIISFAPPRGTHTDGACVPF